MTVESMIICGGPWGQPYHFAHHIAPNLNWYQQILLGNKINNLLTPEQKSFFNVNGSISLQMIKQLRDQKLLEKTVFSLKEVK